MTEGGCAERGLGGHRPGRWANGARYVSNGKSSGRGYMRQLWRVECDDVLRHSRAGADVRDMHGNECKVKKCQAPVPDAHARVVGQQLVRTAPFFCTWQQDRDALQDALHTRALHGVMLNIHNRGKASNTLFRALQRRGCPWPATRTCSLSTAWSRWTKPCWIVFSPLSVCTIGW